MPRKARPSPKPERQKTFIRAWRKKQGLTLAKMIERLEVEMEVEISEAQLSRIENGKSPYSQDLLEAFAKVLRCAPADLIMRDPADPQAIWSIWETLSVPEQRQAEEIIKALKRTGTDG